MPGKTTLIFIYQCRLNDVDDYRGWEEEIDPNLQHTICNHLRSLGHDSDAETIENESGENGYAFWTLRNVYEFLDAILGTAKEASMFLVKCGVPGVYNTGSHAGMTDTVFTSFTDDIRILNVQNLNASSDEDLYETEERTLGLSIKDQGGPSFVTLYRACHTSITTFKDKDYCTLSKKFAIEHAENNHVYHDEPYHVIRGLISSDLVFDAYNPGEYFYSGPEKQGKVIYTSLGPDEYDGYNG
jgi:hypothetical protein